jgi:adenine-specific DNA-methyltransferase
LQNLLKDLENLLQQDQSFISDGAILKNAVVEAALNMEPRLLELLMQSYTIRAHFFTEVAGALVFDKVKFQDFVSNKSFLPDSYTAFKNRIGLTDGRHDYLSQSRDVVLSWPYKDCVLEGGMTKEDRGRNEVFWNTTLAPDDITRLFEPKVLTDWQRWDIEAVLDGKPKPVNEVSGNENLLIKGNNLLALHSLKARYADKVKLIYIDPPYNTGNDGFRYNDRFNHSAWLTFMRNRLEVARELLRRDGAIFVNLDDGEVHYAKVLLDEVFGRDNFVANVVWQKNYTVKNSAKYLSDMHDHILIFAKDRETWRPNLVARKTDTADSYINPDNDSRGPWTTNAVQARNFYSEGSYEIIGPNGRKHRPPTGTYWRVSESTFNQLREDNRIWWGVNGGAIPRIKKFLSEAKDGVVSSTWWKHEDTGTNAEAKDEARKLLEEDNALFLTPKPERLLQRIIEIGSKEKDIVLDFFSGSGTTPAVAQKTGRQWLAIEQMDYILELPASRLKKVIDGEQGGISKATEWQGGGSFVYAELAQSNSVFADRVEAAQDITTLQTIRDDIKATGYLRYDVDLKSFDTNDFSALQLDDAKRVLMDCLDTNHMYVNLSSLGDADFDITDEDVAATRSFYGIKS